MRDQYRLGFVDVGGWDTHVNEGGGARRLATNLTSLGGSAAFRQILGEEWNNTVVFVLSEFGRTFRENGNHGTDHGHGSVYWVLGGPINGGTHRRRAAAGGCAARCSRIATIRCSTITVPCSAACSAPCGVCRPISAGDIFPQVAPVDLKLV